MVQAMRYLMRGIPSNSRYFLQQRMEGATVPGSFLSGPHSSSFGHTVCPNMMRSGINHKSSSFSSQDFFRSRGAQASHEAIQNPQNNLGRFQFSVMPRQEDRRKTGNVSLETCSQIPKETTKNFHLIRTDNLCKMTALCKVQVGNKTTLPTET